MRYTYYFDDEITQESIQELIDVISQVEQVDLFVTTIGGSRWAIDVLMHAINQHPDIVIYLCGYIASAGTFFLTECEQPVYLHENLEWILFHQGDRPVEGEFRKTSLDRHILYDNLKLQNEILGEKYKKLGLTTKEMKRYFEGDDVIIYRKDFNRLKIARPE